MKVYLVSSYPTPNDGISDYTRDLLESLKEQSVEVTSFKVNHPMSLKAIGEWKQIFQRVKEVQPDVVHLQYTPTSLGWRLPWFLRQLKKIHIRSVLTVHEKPDFFIDKLPRLLVKKYLLWERNTFRLASQLIVHTADHFVDIRIRYDIPGNRITTIPHYIQDTPAQGASSGPRLVALGRIVPKKRLDIVIEAVAQLKIDLPELKLLIIGEAPPRYAEFSENLKQLVTKYELESQVEWKGYVAEEDLPQLFSSSDVGVLPYLMGTQSGAAFKLLSHNVPLLTSQLPAFVELMRRYQVGQATELSTAEQLATAVREVLSHPEWQATWRAGIQRLKNEQSLATIAQLHLTLYTRLCQNTLE